MSKVRFTEEQKAAIRAAVEGAEARTSGEIVPVVVAASDDYPGARWRFAVALSLAVAAFGIAFFPAVDPLYWLGAQLITLLLGHLLATRAWLLRPFLARDKVDEEVQQKALESFVELGVHATSERTGVLILVSLLEHRVQVLADTGINAKAPDGYWDELVANLVARIRVGELQQGLIEAIEHCGELLAQHFPPREGAKNQLSDELVTPS